MDQEKQEFKFDVFISYRHADLDSAVAGYLQKALEHYRIPREIQKKCGKKNIHRVFRDEEELGVASDLFHQIEQNLVQSEFLLVICSPRILESKWCMREIETFIRYRGRDNVLAVLIEGEPETAFPAILREEGEPLAADLRGHDKREVLRHARQRLPRLAAPLLYCSYDELYQRHRVYKMRRLAALAGAVAAVSMTFGAVTLMQSREIQRQSQEIQQKSEEIQSQNQEIQQQNQEIRLNYQAKLENQFRYLAKTSSELLRAGDRDAALLVALEALPQGSGDTSRPYVAEARIALEKALFTYAKCENYQLEPFKQLEHKEEIGSIIDRNKEENVLLTTDAGSIYVWDGASCENLCCQAYSGELVDVKLVGNQSAAVMTKTGAYCFNYRTGQVLWQWDLPKCENCYSDPTLHWAYDSKSNQLLCGNWTLTLHGSSYREPALTPAHMLYLLDAATGESRAWMPAELLEVLEKNPEESITLSNECFLLSPGGTWTAILIKPSSLSADNAVLTVFPAGEDRAVYTETLKKEDKFWNYLGQAVFIDEEHLATVKNLQGETGLRMGKLARWRLDIRSMNTGKLRMSYEDACLNLRGNIEIKKLVPTNGDQDDILLSVTYDNVAVNLDWNTGERLARIEDRSTIALNHYFSSSRELVVTADGYLFRTLPDDDTVVDPIYTAYHYYIGISRIDRSAWLDGKAFFFTDSGVYCYAAPTDGSYTALDAYPSESLFTGDSAHVLVMGNDKKIYFYDTEDFSLLWKDEYYYNFDGLTVDLVGDDWVAYLTGDGSVVTLRSIRDGSVRQVQMDGSEPGPYSTRKWHLRAGGAGKVLVWHTDSLHLSTYTKQEEMESTFLWVLDADTGEVTHRWSYQDIFELKSLPFSPDTSLSVYPKWAAATADGRYLLLRCELTGTLKESTDQEEQERLSRILVWDLETGSEVELPQEVQEGMVQRLFLGDYCVQDGWISPTEPKAVFYNEEHKLLQVVDLAKGTLLHSLPVDGITSQEVSFTPDGDHLIFQDGSKRLKIYNWRKGEYTMEEIAPEQFYMKFDFYQDGDVLNASGKPNGITSNTARIFRRTGEGTYKLETSISYCDSCDARTVVIQTDDDPRLYRYYDLDQLIAQAREILDGRELTEMERRSYLID